MKKIAIHSVPRSGSTWLGNIFNSHPCVAFRYQPLFSYAFKDYLGPDASSEQIERFFNEIAVSDDAFIHQKEAIDKRIVPDFEKHSEATHICYKEVRYHHILKNMLLKNKDVQLILLVRNPLAVIHSWKNAPKEFKTGEGWNFEEEWRKAPSKNKDKPEEFNGYEKWKEATYLFLELQAQYPDRVELVEYQDLLVRTASCVKRIFDFSELEYSKQTQAFIEQSKLVHHEDAYSVYKKRESDHDWKRLPSHIIEYIKNDIKSTQLERFIYE